MSSHHSDINMSPCLLVKLGDVPYFDMGYPAMSIKGKRVRLHRKTYEDHYGPIPPGHLIHHRCEQTACLEPSHLAAMTRAEHNRAHARLRSAPWNR